jgi:hypothetical protein
LVLIGQWRAAAVDVRSTVPAMQRERARTKLEQLSPLRILERGYAIVSNERGIVKDAAEAEVGVEGAGAAGEGGAGGGGQGVGVGSRRRIASNFWFGGG